MILNADRIAGCAIPGLFTVSDDPELSDVFVHELGHQPFGLADETCRMRTNTGAFCQVCSSRIRQMMRGRIADDTMPAVAGNSCVFDGLSCDDKYPGQGLVCSRNNAGGYCCRRPFRAEQPCVAD